MNVVHVSFSDGASGGAARAAYRLHRALRGNGAESFMIANDAVSGDWTVAGPKGKAAKLAAVLRPAAGAMLGRIGTGPGAETRSLAVLPGGLNQRLRRQSAALAHLHWINAEMVSIAEIGRLDLPAVWTLHDMWPFCGAEHYAADERWKTGYCAGTDGSPGGVARWIDRWTWQRKKRHWRRPLHIIAPSRWLARCVSESALMGDWPISVIPNAIDTQLWSPLDRDQARAALGLPKDRRVLLFGAVGGTRNPRKGGDLLFQAIRQLPLNKLGVDPVIFGEPPPREPVDLGVPVRYLGRLRDEVSLRLVYAAADVFVLPSRLDNLPNTGVEALACGRPVVSFDTGGLSDIVQHQATGYLAKPFEPGDLAKGIAWVLEDEERWHALSAAAVQHARANFAAPVVAARHIDLYDSLAQESAR